MGVPIPPLRSHLTAAPSFVVEGRGPSSPPARDPAVRRSTTINPKIRRIADRLQQHAGPILYLSLLLLGGCAGTRDVALPATIDRALEADTGVVVGSVGAKPAPGNPPWPEWSRYE